VQTELSGTIGVSQDQTLIAKQKDQICYGISSYDSNSMKSSNPNSGIYEADTSRTLDNNGGNQSCNQGGICVLEGNGSRPSHRGDGFAESETSYTLNSTEKHAVCTY
jgi:DNA (cytosine-5)-methyltransferase 1